MSEDKLATLLDSIFHLHSEPGAEVTPLPGRWIGQRASFITDGIWIENRFIAIGSGVVMLQKVSRETDPFPESKAFFDSLSIDCGDTFPQSGCAWDESACQDSQSSSGAATKRLIRQERVPPIDETPRDNRP
ncbi:hypothetical protein [Myxococcus landrumensis]|uniref:Uncharacterized protein n=1 Tax=Myxococcus landrumensis TaxID=2813577 RepID=A0ABX7MYN3_9BACT|nr:hypothetical protein [Myxococcus landrumus]QSQ11547.1 hypothetical protein JY572_24435 [Myxococcus landrumus]